MAADDFYQVLGVSRDAGQDEIQRAYRKLARTYHPDVNRDPAAEDRFKQVSEAYDVLSDPAVRRRYDQFGPDFRQVPEGVDPEMWARARAAGQTGGRSAAGAGGRAGTGDRAGPGGWPPDDPGWSSGAGWYGGPVDLEDLLGEAFAGRAGTGRAGTGRGWGPVPGADQEAELPLTIEEAHRGGRRTVTIERLDGPQRLTVSIPAGVVDGQRIRLAGQGGRGGNGAPAGDLYLVVRLQPHPRYRVAGRDLTVDLPLTPWEAALGASVAVPTPDGEAKVRVPPGTSTGRRLRLRGRGLPGGRGGHAGDLFAQVQIMVPDAPTEPERRLFEQLASASTFDPRR